MKLTWGEPFWPTQSPAIRFPPPQADLRCDVLVVGAGVTGALIADALVQAGRDVVVIDKRQPGRGSTAASTSLLLYELDTPLVELAKRMDMRDARRVYQMGVEAIRHLGNLASSLPDDCGFRTRQSVYLCSDDRDFPDLARECETRQEAGLRVELLGREELRDRFGFDRAGAILSHDAAEIDPFRLTRELLARAAGSGVRVFGDCALERAHHIETAVVAKTSAGPTITAGHVIYATGYEAASLFDKPQAQRQVTYAAVSEPLHDFTGWWERALLWETARPYLYLRTTSDNRAMIGGLDDHHHDLLTDETHLRRKSEQLKARFEELFPHIPFTIDATWAGIFETTSDGMPYIGPHPRFPRSFFALGYGGNGLTFAVIASQIIQDLYTGKSNADAQLFRFDRR